jgi:hypothetical protein
MYFISAKDRKENWYIEQIVKDWHDAVDGFEPIDCTKDEMVIFDETGRKFLVGPDRGLGNQKVGRFGGWVDVGEWDFKNGEPFLIDAQETDQNGLRSMLVDYIKRNRLRLVVEPDTLSFAQVVEVIKRSLSAIQKNSKR